MTKGIANIKQFTTMVRDMGVGLVVADQIPSNLSDFIKANVYAQICFNLSFRKDIQEMAYTMNLNEQQRICIPSLRQGQAIVKIADHPVPFLVHAPYPDKMPYISDSKLEAMTKAALAELGAKVIPSRKPEKVQTEEVQTVQDEKPLEEWEKFLRYIKDHPDYNVSSTYKSYGISGRKGTRLKEQLKGSGLIKEVKVGTNQRGRSSLRLELTEKGYKYINETPVQHPQETLQGKGSEEHKRLQKLVQEHFVSEGKIAIIEAQLGNKKIDVLVQDITSKKITAVEIQLTEKHATENALKDLEAGCDEVLFLCKNEGILEKVKAETIKNIDEQKQDRIQFHKIDGLIPLKNKKT